MSDTRGWDRAQLEALAAAVDHETFDAAARALHITPSAFSQRIRALERSVGQLVLRRTKPCRTTPAGAELLRLARQLALLEDETAARLEGPGTVTTQLPLAINADSVGSWFAPVLAEIGTWPGVALRLRIEDQDHSADLLRSGETLAAVTSDPQPVQGCSIEPLGAMRYLPVATPELIERTGAVTSRGTIWSRLPLIRFNAKDDLQHGLLRRLGAEPGTPVHLVPSSADFAVAVRAGLGWGLVPEHQLGDDLTSGRLRRLGRRHVDIALHWQRWRLASDLLDRLTRAVRSAARAHLRTP